MFTQTFLLPNYHRQIGPQNLFEQANTNVSRPMYNEKESGFPRSA